MMFLVLVSGRLQTTTWQDHAFMVLQGMCLFSLNFVCFYTASLAISSGLLSVILSYVTLFNALNNPVFWKERPTGSVFGAGALGIIGLSLMFWPEITAIANMVSWACLISFSKISAHNHPLYFSHIRFFR
jgi:drug/metabolite transporter (DMT)-like permease